MQWDSIVKMSAVRACQFIPRVRARLRLRFRED